MNTMLRKMTLALLLCVAGVVTAWAQTYTKGAQVTSVSQLSTDKLYFIEHIRTDDVAGYGYSYLNGRESAGSGNYCVSYNSSLPTTANKSYVWRLEDAGDGKYYLQNASAPQAYIAHLTWWKASYATTGDNKGEFTITAVNDYADIFGKPIDPAPTVDCTGRFFIMEGTMTIGGMVGYPKGNGICGDNLKHAAKIYEAQMPNPADYSTNYSGVTLNRKDRAVTAISLQTSFSTQTISDCQSSTANPPLFIDKTSTTLTCKAGEVLRADVTSNAGWTHLYVYIDEDADGFGYEVDAANHCAAEGSDLKTFTHYKFGGSTGYNSVGEVTAGDVSLHFAPTFVAPTKPGTYRVRYKTDWNNIDPMGDLGDGSGAPSGSNNIVKNGGAIIDFMLRVEPLPSPAYTITYVDENDNLLPQQVAQVTTGSSIVTSDCNIVSVDATVSSFYGLKDFLFRDFVSATVNGNTYNSWTELTSAETGNANVVVKLASQVVSGKYFAIKHAGNTARYMFDTGAALNALEKTPTEDTRYIFTVEEAGDGRFYLRNAGTGRYVKRTGASGIENNQAIPTIETLNAGDCVYYITNALVPNRREFYGIADAHDVPNPTIGIGNQRYLHCNKGQNVVRWSTQNTANNNSQWYLENIPTITLTFKNSAGDVLEGVTYTATNSGKTLPYGTVLSCFKGIAFDDYAVLAYDLNGQEYSTRTQFFEACHRLTVNANATLTLREKDPGEVDVTLQLWKVKGNGYTNADCTEGEFVWADHDANAAANLVGKKAWKLNVGASDEDIKGAPVPADIDFRIVSLNSDAGVGGQIISSNGNGAYKYGMDPSGPNCICFTAATGEGNTFEFKVADGYYILQYNLGLLSSTNSQVLVFSNPGGSTVQTANPGADAQRYTITDTPAAQTCQFTAVAQRAGANMDCSANYFRVRIVNQLYLENSMERGYAICFAALHGDVGYPKESTAEYAGLKTAMDNFDAADNLANYVAMLQAYSKYISCRDLKMPEDCQVYTLSFVKSDGGKVLINNGENGLEMIDYTAENREQPSARWISHEAATGKLVLVNKKDGKYLQSRTATDGLGISETYDANTNSFDVANIHQDINDYMASATDEKLLGAVYMKAAARPTSSAACTLTLRNSDNTFETGSDPRYDNLTSAIAIEPVDGGSTYNAITFRKASDDKFYSTYCGFYPVANPDGADMYYVTEAINGYLHLQKVQANVIRPNFPVILISDNDQLHSDGEEGQPTHLHIGKYTAEIKSQIDNLLQENGQNILQGTTTERVRTSDIDGTVYVLSGGKNKGTNIGFYKYSGDLPLNKAYYVHPENAEIRGFLFYNEDGEETRIELNKAEAPKNAVIYDLSGRRVTNATKGIFIINGKKVCL